MKSKLRPPCITDDHLKRSAMVYVRQSSNVQVRDNMESTRLQRGLQEKAKELGWRNPVLIEDDLGETASGFSDRCGFHRMLTSVTNREVGVIFCFELSRLSRNSPDWARLMQFCLHFDTLVADTNQIYDLTQSNDRLMLGIRGTISEVELATIQLRLRTALEAKAERGELKMFLPCGYVHDGNEIVFDPDESIQSAIRRLFEDFRRYTSVRQLAMAYRAKKLLFPSRRPSSKNSVTWALASARSLNNILVHPIYAGSYVRGRKKTITEFIDGKLTKRVQRSQDPKKARVHIRDHHAAYITWEQYEANVAKISENRARRELDASRGAIREGLALLTGMLRCGHCGGLLRVRYRQSNGVVYGNYHCDRNRNTTARTCVSVLSTVIDPPIVEELCRALDSSGIQAAIRACEESEAQREADLEFFEQRVQAARYAADRALDQYDECDPKNRLVADTLERRLNDKLRAVADAREQLEKISRTPALTNAERERLDNLARTFLVVWKSSAEVTLKKTLLRSAVHEIVVKDVGELPTQPGRRGLEVTIHWKGGVHTSIQVIRSTRSKASKDEPMVDLVKRLNSASHSDREIARVLNRRDPTISRWTQDNVTQFREQHHIPTVEDCDSDRLSMNAAAKYLGISVVALRTLATRGAITSNQVAEFACWRVHREELDSPRVQNLVKALKQVGRFPREEGDGHEGQLTMFDGDI
jgi:DNA invertase Pin-like site-specific DNA recombinase